MAQQVTIQQAIELALQHHRAGELPQAESIYRQVLQQQPNNPDAMQLLGALAHHTGNNAAAVELIGKSLSINPNQPHCYNNIGQALAALGRIDEAIAAFQKAATMQADYAAPWTNLGDVQTAVGRHREAVAAYRAAMKIHPEDASLCNKLGAALLELSANEEAAEWLNKALGLQPDLTSAINNLARSEQARGNLARAIELYEKAIAAEPEVPEPHLNLALALMANGDFVRGHEEYEWRLKCPAWMAHPDPPMPRWTGGDLAGKTLLLHSEQGFGDTFQLIRFAPMLVEHGAKLILGTRPEARKLLEHAEGISSTVIPGEPMPPADLFIHIPSIPWLLGTTLETIPNKVPYLFADEDRKRVWRERVDSAGGRLRVGLTWRGQTLPYPNRSFALKDAVPLARVDDVVFHSFQVGEGAEEALNPPEGMKIIDHRAELTDFSETAALMANLDLIVSIDTATAHLAGAMGLPTLTLLPFAASHQWLRDRADSPWYPTMRLIRQSREGDWGPVFEEVARELAARAAG